MKKLATLLLVSMLGGILTLGSYKLFMDKETFFIQEKPSLPNYIPTNYAGLPDNAKDFTEAAKASVNAVVHVKNIAVRRGFPLSSRDGMALQGAGSGVIISPDGYIITNNHVIQKANKLQVTLNNNQNYMAEIVGTDPKSDIALLKIDAEDLDYLTFGNSNDAQIGEWVLAVGNPFNLTSTVTAGIISAKSRDLGMGADVSSFIQTDAAVNPGNSGGALVNTRGELIGINTAITSQTGTYVGYAFAVPSNNARKIVQDIMEFGNVQQGRLGIAGVQAGSMPGELNNGITEGVYVNEVISESGAAIGGIRKGDIITRIDNIPVRKFSDLTGYIGSKRPGDVVEVNVLRKGQQRTLDIRLTKEETFPIQVIGLEVTNASESDLKKNKVKNGVKITRGLTPQMESERLTGTIITEIDNTPVRNIDDVKRIIENKDRAEPISVTFVAPNGEKQKYVWR